MKEKRGFTLIELLAVIVILAIIALIATPIVLSLISRARKGAAEDSGYGLRKAAQLYYTSSLLNATSFEEITFKCNGTSCKEKDATTGEQKTGDDAKVLSIDGTIPDNGDITIKSTGEIEVRSIKIGGFDCVIPAQGKVICGDDEDEVVEEEPNTGISGSEAAGTTPSGNEQGGTTPSGNEQGGTTPSGNEQGGTTPTIATCPGCQFIFTTSTYAIEGSPSASEYSSDIPAGTTNDYTTLIGEGGHPYFLGIIPSQTNPNKIGRAFSCGIENGTAFCVEGYDTSKFDSNVSTLNATIPDCDASSEFDETGCSDESDFGAHIFSFGVVDVYDDFGFCYVDTEGYFDCTVS